MTLLRGSCPKTECWRTISRPTSRPSLRVCTTRKACTLVAKAMCYFAEKVAEEVDKALNRRSLEA